uniref:NIPSNAP domain-containing protein n=1 Tax=Elaeophora elaphi TaxID=1147741 RepID=A0A0R3RT23_9BILA
LGSIKYYKSERTAKEPIAKYGKTISFTTEERIPFISEILEQSQMSSSNKSSDIEDYYGYWQLYPNNARARRRFLQLEAFKNGGPFCIRVIAAVTTAYHVAYYTYQFTAVSPEHQRDLRHVIWLKRKLPFFASIGIRYKEEIAIDREKSS